jgi:SAM-dependent methyltransferase
MSAVAATPSRSPLQRLRLYLSLLRYSNAHNRDFAREHYAFFAVMLEELRQHGKDPRGQRVLDVGCGKSYWLTLLLHSYGAQVTGVDTEYVQAGFRPGKYYSILRWNGFERALKTLVWDLVYARPYYRELARQCPFALKFDGMDTRVATDGRMEFPENGFDLAVSHEVFEHIRDVDAVARDLSKLLTPDGLTYIYVHNFASISGGHHIAWKYPDTEPSPDVPPWDHLREKRFPDIPSWVNSMREAEYREIFARYFTILEWIPSGREGASLLLPEIRHELGSYSEDELLTKGFTIVARPKAVENASIDQAASS